MPAKSATGSSSTLFSSSFFSLLVSDACLGRAARLGRLSQKSRSSACLAHLSRTLVSDACLGRLSQTNGMSQTLASEELLVSAETRIPSIILFGPKVDL